MVALDVAHRQLLRRGHDIGAAQRQPVRRVIVNLETAQLRFEQQSEGRIAGDVDAVDGVHLNRDFSGPAHSQLLLRTIVACAWANLRFNEARARQNNEITPEDCRIFPHSFMDWPRLAKQGRP